MQSELKSLSKIFSETIFRIPDYQRGYSWGAKQLKDFWNDIEQLPKGQSHYTGVLTLEPVQSGNFTRWDDDLWIIEAKRYTPIYVVDGQQRLTTAIILLQALLDKIEDDAMLNYTPKSEIRKKYIFESKDQGISRSYLFGYEKDNPSYEFLKQRIFGEDSDIHSIAEETIYTKNLRAAKEYFAEQLTDCSTDRLEQIFTILTQHLQFNIFYIEKDLDVFVTFETMNNRGKLLSHLELLKNRLIYLSTKFDVERAEREQLRRAINESWKTVYHFLGKMESKKFDDDVFLKTHFICYFGPTHPKLEDDDGGVHEINRYIRHDEQYKDYLLEQVFTPKRLQQDSATNKMGIEELYQYAQNIKSTVKTYYHTTSPDSSDWPDEEKISLTQINRLSNYSLLLLCVASQINYEQNDARRNLLQAIERLGFLSKIRAYFFSDIDVYKKAISIAAKELNAEDFAKEIKTQTDRFLSSPEFLDAIKNIGKASGYYGWGALGYLMYEYEQHLRKQSKTSRQLLDWLDYSRGEIYENDHKTIEHVYPQKAVDQYWKDQFNAYSVPERNILKNSLGNLLPVSHGKNSSLSNKSFEQKKGTVENQVGYRYGCLSEIQVALHENWGAKEILRRGVMLLEFMELRWGFKIGDASAKVDALGLGFVLNREGVMLERLLAVPLPHPASMEDSSTVPKPRARRILRAEKKST
jgi:Protein of unknown function DUF262/Protein of unknown function (DUF1524)